MSGFCPPGFKLAFGFSLSRVRGVPEVVARNIFWLVAVSGSVGILWPLSDPAIGGALTLLFAALGFGVSPISGLLRFLSRGRRLASGSFSFPHFWNLNRN